MQDKIQTASEAKKILLLYFTILNPDWEKTPFAHLPTKTHFPFCETY